MTITTKEKAMYFQRPNYSWRGLKDLPVTTLNRSWWRVSQKYNPVRERATNSKTTPKAAARGYMGMPSSAFVNK
jgi:hypothetical protein